MNAIDRSDLRAMLSMLSDQTFTEKVKAEIEAASPADAAQIGWAACYFMFQDALLSFDRSH